MSLRRKLLFSAQNIHNFEKLLCQQGAAITQECNYHILSSNQPRSKEREKGKWRGYSGSSTPRSLKVGYGILAVTAGAAIGEFNFRFKCLNVHFKKSTS